MKSPFSALRRCTTVAALLAALATAGCAGQQAPAPQSTDRGQDRGFAAEWTAITTDYASRSQEIQRQAAQAKGQGLERTLEMFLAIKETSDEAAEDLRELAAPAQVRDPMATLIQLLGQQSTLLDSLVEAAEANNNAEVARATEELTRLVRQVQLATAQLNNAISECGADCA